jgi:hypothetical protein
MTLSRQLPGLGASGSALAANSAPVCARGARRSERVLAGWRIFGRNRAPYVTAARQGTRCRGVGARQIMGQRYGEISRTGKGRR